MNQPVQTNSASGASELVEQVTGTVRQGVQAASDQFSGKPEGIRETITHAFGDSATGPKWGAVGGASIITLVTGLLGFTMGGPLGALAGVAGGLTIGTLIGPALNGLWEKMGFPAAEKPPMPGRAPEAQADPDVGLLRGIEISQPGTPLSDRTNMLVPNLERFKQVSSESAGLVSGLVARRQAIDAMPHSARREGAIKRLLEDETGASKLLANAQLWDQMVAEWSKPGGERDKLKTALGTAMNANGQMFDENIIPMPPVVRVNVPPMSFEMENYALDMLQAEGKGRGDWDKMRPQDKLNYVWNKAEEEAKKNEFDWSKMEVHFANIPFLPRTKLPTPIGVGNNIGSAATPYVYGHDNVAQNRNSLEALKVTMSFQESTVPLLPMQTDVLSLAKKCYEERDYATLIEVARLGQEATEKTHLFGNDPEAKAEFVKLERYAESRLRQQQASQQYEQVYAEIQRVEAISKNQFPKFIAEVEKLEVQVRELNARTQEQNRQRTATADVPAPTSAPSTPQQPAEPNTSRAPTQTP